MERLPIHQKNWILSQRKNFFDEIIAALSAPPTSIDTVLGQAKWYSPPHDTGRIVDPDKGNLYLEFSFLPMGENGPKIDFAYSVYQIGYDMRIGVLLRPSTGIRLHDQEVGFIWPNCEPKFLARGDLMIWDWYFEVPELYSYWVQQERFILGLRHMHFRVLDMMARDLQKTNPTLTLAAA